MTSNTTSASSELPTLEAIKHQIDGLHQAQSNTVQRITVCPKDFKELVRELSRFSGTAMTPPSYTTPRDPALRKHDPVRCGGQRFS